MRLLFSQLTQTGKKWVDPKLEVWHSKLCWIMHSFQYQSVVWNVSKSFIPSYWLRCWKITCDWQISIWNMIQFSWSSILLARLGIRPESKKTENYQACVQNDSQVLQMALGQPNTFLHFAERPGKAWNMTKMDLTNWKVPKWPCLISQSRASLCT